MERCDDEADQEIVARYGRREGLVTEYFAAITERKNRIAAERLLHEFSVAGGALLCGDLGIVPGVWFGLGLEDRRPACLAAGVSFWARARRVFTEPVPCHHLERNGDNWLLIGRPERVGQYLKTGEIKLCPLAGVTRWWFHLQLRAIPKMGSLPLWCWRLLSQLNWPWRLRYRSVTLLAATIHEDTVALARLAKVLGLDYVNLQDSFLPSYYPSRYLLYRPAVRRFYVWDRFSHGIFRRHGLESAMWGAYGSWRMPAIRSEEYRPVRRILYLSSGAGDWTALKNRSDEDLALLLLVEVAWRRPDVQIRYRPHPLWLHPEHQGLNSIERVEECVRDLGMPNLHVSLGARNDGSRFSTTGNLSAVSSSLDADIDWADLVMGEHSQTILVAARCGKLIAGLNVTRHCPFFGDYSNLGFPLVTSASGLLELIGSMEADSVAFLRGYNAAIERHNRENT